MKGYLSVQQTADKWGVSVRWVNQYILDGRIPGCERFGRVWAIPEDAVKPKRLTPGVKAKRSSSAQNAAKKSAEYFLPKQLAKANEKEIPCLSMSTAIRIIRSSCFWRR